MLDSLVKDQNECLKKENKLIRDTIRHLTNFANGHRNEREVQEVENDLQTMLGILENQRNLITSFERTLESSQLQYENILEKSLQEARNSSSKPMVNHYLAEQVVKAEKQLEALQAELRSKISQTAKEITEHRTAQIYQNAELLQMPVVPSRSPSMHKSGVRVNEVKKNKYLAPL